MRNFKPRGLESLLIALLLIPPSVSAEIFKCVGENDVIKLQNFPCSIDSIGSTAVAGSPATADRARAAGPAANAPPAGSAISTNLTPQPHTLKAVIRTGEEPNGEEPYLGMRMDQVRAQWGDPKGVREINGVETWYYDGPGDSTRGVQFDRAGKVKGIGGDEGWQPL
jgi:hypothetical protein